MKNTGGSVLRYELRAQIDHHGGSNGGHYVARVLRDKWYLANDMTVVPSNPEINANNYLLFYELKS
jgi:ubiquitin C-terminal hydrolase